MSVLSDPSVFLHCPPILASKIAELHSERLNSGVETTPDETSIVIESLFEHLGRLWMAELWHAVEFNTLDLSSSTPLLLSIVENMQRRSLTTGTWVRFCRQISHLFKQEGTPTAIEGLGAVDWGLPNDDGLVSNMIQFRNRFAHGTFEAPIEIIDAGYRDIDTFIQQIPGLWKQSWHVLTTDGWKLFSSTSLTSSSVTPPQEGATIVVETEQGEMALNPFFSHIEAEHGIAIQLPMWKPSTVDMGLQQEQISAWYKQYRKEYAGLIDRRPVIEQRKHAPLNPEHWNAIVPLLTNHGQTSVIIGHPGTGIMSILPKLIDEATVNQKDWMVWDVQPDDLTQSATCFVRAIGERLQSGIFADEEGHIVRKFKSLAEQFEVLKPLLQTADFSIAIDGLQFAHSTYRFESHTVAEVCNWLTELGVSLLLIYPPARTRTPIFFTTQMHWQSSDIVNPHELCKTREWLGITSDSLYQHILEALANKPDSSLFEICDLLDASQPADAPPIFEPKVEYALWHLHPLLRTKVAVDVNKQSRRVWSLFNTEVNQ